MWIGTVRATRGGAEQSQLALSPRVAGRQSTAVVVRFDDSFSSVWAGRSDSSVAAAVSASLRSMLDAAAGTHVTLTEIQLDYDCPERLLPHWSAVVAQLGRGVLAGRTVWLTSIPAHVRRRDYGDLFRGSVAGHILQVFDTGDRMSLGRAGQLERLASAQRMPFRLGVAGFERRLANGRTTDHRAWFEATRVMARSRWYRGVWVFPGGTTWVNLLEAPR